MKESDSPQTFVKRVHHIRHVLVRLVCRLKIAPSSYRFLHFGLLFPPLCAMKESDSPQTVVKVVYHIHHVLIRLVCRLKVAPSSYHFLHFGLLFPPLYAMKESDSPQTVVKRECTIFITLWSV